MSSSYQINVTWTKDMEQDLKDLIAQGNSGTKTAEILSRKYKRSFTRNAVIGKASRLKLVMERKVSANAPEKKTPKKITKNKIENKIVLVEEKTAVIASDDQDNEPFKNPKANPTKLLDLQEGQCKYPQGDVREGNLIFCGAPADSMLHRSYCSFCYDIVYYPISKTLRSRYRLPTHR